MGRSQRTNFGKENNFWGKEKRVSLKQPQSAGSAAAHARRPLRGPTRDPPGTLPGPPKPPPPGGSEPRSPHSPRNSPGMSRDREAPPAEGAAVAAAAGEAQPQPREKEVPSQIPQGKPCPGCVGVWEVKNIHLCSRGKLIISPQFRC